MSPEVTSHFVGMHFSFSEYKAIQIWINNPSINRDCGVDLPTVYNAILKKRSAHLAKCDITFGDMAGHSSTSLIPSRNTEGLKMDSQ